MKVETYIKARISRNLTERGKVMVLSATFNNISAILWQSIVLVEETGKNPPTCHKSLANFIP